MSPARRALAARVGLGLALAAVLVALGVRARDLLVDEAAQARLRVDDAQHALAENDRPRAVLALERARLFAPRADFVRAALAAADVQDPEALVPRTLRLVTPLEWSALATTFGWLGGLGLAVIVLRRRVGALGGVALGSGLVLALGVAALASTHAVTLSVVTSHDEALVAPYRGAATQGRLAPGDVVVLETTQGAFGRVRAGDGREGWVALDHLESTMGPAS